MSIALKRAYDAPDDKDGQRILVDRVWPRGVSKDDLHLDGWYREVAPSTELRKWFAHDPERWPEFQKRYLAELRRAPLREPLEELAKLSKRRKVTLVYGARDEEHNQAVVLRDYLRKLAAKPSS
ncbi:MAG TPA: DUF488 family protein [Candidatus Baltobacteraceae bacterium]|nr:DUF488 family protein [Candidatus Baltobacteraceae bacterium]